MARIFAPRIFRFTCSSQKFLFPCSSRLSLNPVIVANRKWRSHDSRPIKENPSFVVPLEQYDQSTPVSSSSQESEEDAVSDPSSETEIQLQERKLTLKDIPNDMRHQLVYKGCKLPNQVVIGKKGVDHGVLNSLHLHFRKRDVVRVKISKMWKDSIANIAQELEEKSGGVIIHRGGSRVLLFRASDSDEFPVKDRNRKDGWYDQFKKEKKSP